MSGIISVVAVDPGATTGMCFLDYFVDMPGPVELQPQATLLQADGKSADAVLEAMLARWYGLGNDAVVGRFAAVEKFVTGRGAGTKGPNADVTRQLVMELTERLQLHGYPVKIRSAADVKPWATDKRLVKAGIVGESAIHGKARDAYDAARHALYAAVKDAKRTDPLA
jgi:hypothetical protein